MRMHAFHRTELLLGREGYARVAGASVCVIGLGGVGSYAAEALARSGVGHLTLVDFDRVCLTNLNRQLHALRSTVGQPKADLMADRARDVHPRCDVRPLTVFYGPDTCDAILDRPYDAVLDCIDHLPNKVHLLRACLQRGLPVWSAMGAGGRLDPTRIRVSDLSETRNDPFARWVRQGLRDLGVPTDAATGVQAVWTDEPPAELDAEVEAGFVCICPDKAGSPFACDDRHQVQGTVAWMPPMFGLAMAGAVVHALAGRDAVRRPAEAPRERMRPAEGKLSNERKRALSRAALPGLTITSSQTVEGALASTGGAAPARGSSAGRPRVEQSAGVSQGEGPSGPAPVGEA